MTTIALIGNPNSGKSTLFNVLTGARQRVGNWPGVTVEKKTGSIVADEASFEILDLPGVYDLNKDGSISINKKIVLDYLDEDPPEVIVNVVDATTLARSLFLTTQLRDLRSSLIVCVNMVDVAERDHIEIDCDQLAQTLGCPVIPMVASKNQGTDDLVQSVKTILSKQKDGDVGQPSSIARPNHRVALAETGERYQQVDNLVEVAVKQEFVTNTVTSMIDRVVLSKYLAFPVFLFVMYLMFLFTLNIGSALIDFFDIAGQALFVEGPRTLFASWGIPGWLIALLCDGVGGGIQLVCTFIPVIACLLLFLALLEDCGYMSRVAFILDRLMQELGLPGKSFVPLVIGFGCNVPSVMGTRNLDSSPDRILTTIMSPFMSCGARLTVFALFAAAFFPSGGHNIIFGLYLFGILVAVGSAWIVRKRLLPNAESTFTLELPSYHLPTLRGVLTQTWFRLRSFVLRAGKAIVIVVVVLNFVSSIGKDGSYGNQDSENSLLSEVGKTMTPIFAPMGISEENWPATVSIFTGMFAKEVVVGTLDALYTVSVEDSEEFDLLGELGTAVQTIPANIASLGSALLDPLGFSIEESSTIAATAEIHQVQINTVSAMQALFGSASSAFSYLVFILLYMPCVATIAAIYHEIGKFWAAFCTGWSLVIAYCAAVISYQLLTITENTLINLLNIAWTLALAVCMFSLLLYAAKRHVSKQPDLIVARSLD